MLPTIEELQELTDVIPNFIVILYTEDAIQHIVTYEEEPDTNDYAALYEELKTDPTLGMTEIVEELNYVCVTLEEYTKHYLEAVEDVKRHENGMLH